MKTITILKINAVFILIALFVGLGFSETYSQDNGEIIVIWNGEDVSPDWIPIAIDEGDLNNNASNPDIGDDNPSQTVMSVFRRADGPPWAGAMLPDLNVDINIQTFQKFSLMIYKEVLGNVQLELQFEDYDNIHLNVENTVTEEWELIEFTLPEEHVGVDATLQNILVAPHQHETEGDEEFHEHTMYWDHVQAHEYTVETSQDEMSYESPRTFTLEQNYPNPFNPITQISFNVPEYSNVKIDVYNALGRHVATLLNNDMTPGNHTVQFDGSRLSSGIYFYHLRTNEVSLSRKMTLLK